MRNLIAHRAQPESELPAFLEIDDVQRLSASEACQEWQSEIKERYDMMGHPNAARIHPHLIAKQSMEGGVMRLVRQHTTIPVPRIHYSHLNDVGYTIMDFIPGRSLLECWTDLSWFTQIRIVCTMRTYVKQLRQIPNTRGTLGDVTDGIVSSLLFEHIEKEFDSVRRFRRFCTWQSYAGWRDIRSDVPPVRPLAVDWTLVFIHGDLNVSNLILADDGVLWVIDWQCAGFYPAAFETMSMQYVDGNFDHQDGRPGKLPRSWTAWIPFMAGYVSPLDFSFWRLFTGGIARTSGH